MLGGLRGPVAFGRKLKAAQRFRPKRKKIGLRRIVKPNLDRPNLIGRVPGFVELCLFRDMRLIEAAIFDVAGKLIQVRLAAPRLSVPSAPRQPINDPTPGRRWWFTI